MGCSYHEGVSVLFCTGSLSGLSEIKCSRNFNEIHTLRKRKELWKNCKRCGGKRDALKLPFIRYCNLQIQVCFCHFLVYQVIYCFSFVVYGIEVISEAQNQMVFLAVLSDSSCSPGCALPFLSNAAIFEELPSSMKSVGDVIKKIVILFLSYMFFLSALS